MSQPQPKRSRSQSEHSEGGLQSEIGTETTVSRESKYSTYQDPRYPVLLERKGSFMRDSRSGPLPEELAWCKELLAKTPIPEDPLLEQHTSRLLELLQNRSELCIYIHLHPRLVPSAELLSLQEPHKFDDLVEGHNDRWNKALVFYKKLPQPDRTVAYRDSVLTDQQRSKLGILPEASSPFAAREGMLFPYLPVKSNAASKLSSWPTDPTQTA